MSVNNPTGKAGIWADETFRERVKAMWADGMSYTQIGNKLGMTRSAIGGGIDRMGLPKRDGAARNRFSRTPRVIPMPKPKAPPAPPPEAPEPVLVDGKPITLLTARACQCRWIADEMPRGDSPICGHDTTAPSEPFCAYHRSRAYNVQHRQSDAA